MRKVRSGIKKEKRSLLNKLGRADEPSSQFCIFAFRYFFFSFSGQEFSSLIYSQPVYLNAQRTNAAQNLTLKTQATTQICLSLPPLLQLASFFFLSFSPFLPFSSSLFPFLCLPFSLALHMIDVKYLLMDFWPLEKSRGKKAEAKEKERKKK